MYKTVYPTATHYTREDEMRTAYGVVSLNIAGQWCSTRILGNGANLVKVHESRWQAERELEGFHTIADGRTIVSRDDIYTVWRDTDGRELAFAKKQPDGTWLITVRIQRGSLRGVHITRTRADREAIELWAERNV